jgi:DNA (cytosine-5)-methyltransferase 1
MEKIMNGFSFGDLFAGVGGFHIALKSIGGECLYASEIDAYARKTYEINHNMEVFGDICSLNVHDLPYVDLITFGFPCQDLSSIGTRQGLQEGTRSSLVYKALEICNCKQPKAFIAENVKGLLTHNRGETFRSLINFMEIDLGYKVYYKLINSLDFLVPQNRERVYIVGIRKNLLTSKEFVFPKPLGRVASLQDFLEENVHPKYNLSDHLLKSYIYKVDDGRPYKVTRQSKNTRTLNSSYHKIQRLTGTFVDLDGYNLRKLTPREFFNLQGFPRDFKITVSDTQAYRQAGNAVSVPVAQAVATEVARYLELDNFDSAIDHLTFCDFELVKPKEIFYDLNVDLFGNPLCK